MGYDGYIRVSRVGGRAGDSFISPDVQRERINAWAISTGNVIEAWHEDFDQSGGKTKRPGLNSAMERCREGQSNGIVVAKIDRFARSLVGALELIRELEDVGAEFVSVAEGIDSTTPAGKMMQRLMLVLAEFELDRIRDSWRDARQRAVARGIHISSAIPAGYRRNADRVLEPDPIHAPAIRQAFEQAAAGVHWRIIGEHLTRLSVPGPYGEVNWIVQNVVNVIRNPVYKGEARSGEFVNMAAHTPIVSPSLWQQANHQRKPTPARSNSPALLAGLIRCAGCQHIMRPDSMKRVSGEHKGRRMRTYRCRVEYASGQCTAPASVAGWVIEPWLVRQLETRLKGIDFHAQGRHIGERVTELENELEQASFELEVFRDQRIADALSVDEFAAGLRARSDRIDEISIELARVKGVVSADMDLLVADELGDLETDELRILLGSTIDAVMIRRGRAPIDDRAHVLWTGELPDSVPRKGKRRPLRSFKWPDSPH